VVVVLLPPRDFVQVVVVVVPERLVVQVLELAKLEEMEVVEE
jgi:hypothetical protein